MFTKGYSHLRNFLQIYKQILCIMYKRKNAQKFILKHYLKDLICFFLWMVKAFNPLFWIIFWGGGIEKVNIERLC